MDFNKLFRKFKQRLLRQGLIKAGIFALTMGACTVFTASLLLHLVRTEVALQSLALAFFIVFLFSFSLMFFVCEFPTKKKIAAAIDATGLQERIGTMLEFQEDISEILTLQRQDALTHLHRTNPKQIRFRFSKKEVFLCLATVILATGILFVPYDLFAEEIEITEEAVREELVRELIADMREEVKNAALSAKLEDELNQIINNLETQLAQSNSNLEAAAFIEQATQDLQSTLEDYPDTEALMEALEALMEEALNALFGIIPKPSMEAVMPPQFDMPESTLPEDGGEGMPEGEMPDGENPEGENPNEDGENGEGEEDLTMIERFYDPLLGEIPYGEVFAAYYAQYLRASENGEIPKELEEIMNRYFEILEQ